MISPEDLDLFQYADDRESAFAILRDRAIRRRRRGAFEIRVNSRSFAAKTKSMWTRINPNENQNSYRRANCIVRGGMTA